MSRGWFMGWLALLALLVMVLPGCVVHTTPQNRAHRPRPRRPRRPRPPPRMPPPPAPAQSGDQAGDSAALLSPKPGNAAPQPVWKELPRVRVEPLLLPAGLGTGRPAGFEPGAPAAYWIWQGPRGGWRVKTTTKQAPHHFRGRVKSTSSGVANVHPSRTEHRDRIRPTPLGWAFSFRTRGHADGFTFVTRDNGCVRFDLLTDGGPVPKRIFIGKTQHQPATGHFILCPKGRVPGEARRR